MQRMRIRDSGDFAATLANYYYCSYKRDRLKAYLERKHHFGILSVLKILVVQALFCVDVDFLLSSYNTKSEYYIHASHFSSLVQKAVITFVTLALYV